MAWYCNYTTTRREAQEIWHEHERVISDVAAGKRANFDDFEAAVHFFEKLTKISVPSDHSTFIDIMPTRETATSWCHFGDGMPKIGIDFIGTRNSTK